MWPFFDLKRGSLSFERLNSKICESVRVQNIHGQEPGLGWLVLGVGSSSSQKFSGTSAGSGFLLCTPPMPPPAAGLLFFHFWVFYNVLPADGRCCFSFVV